MLKKATSIVLFIASTAAADAPPRPQPLSIPRASGAIRVDGDLSDAAWKSAAVIDQFYETSPSDNIPAKVKTVAYVMYDEKYFYIGIRADDPNPKLIRAPYVDRDQVIGTDDNIAIFLDTRNDKRTALELRVNPRGIQADGIFNDGNFNEDFSPDYFYDTAATIDGTGWSAEFRIPFASLRYTKSDPQTWNILVWRNYPRDFRYAFHSAPMPRDSNCFVCHAHPIVGLTGLPEAGNLIAAPYVTAQQVERPVGGLGGRLEREPFGRDAGIDVKWTPTANNAIDLTLNPDFSQIETDVAQITVNQRFAVFFPEKRPFFLEGFDLFDTPLQVAYTRTITAPRFGARSTGKLLGAAYTLLVTDDRGGGLTILPGPLGSDFALQDFKSLNAIARVRRDFGGRSFFGAVFTDREMRGGGHNRVFGPDILWRPNEGDSIAAELLVSDTRNLNRPDLSPSWNGSKQTGHAFTTSWNHQARAYDWFVQARDFGDDFRADLGFIPQVGYRELFGGFGLRRFPENSKLRFVRPNIFVDQQTDRDNNTILRRISPGVFVIGAKNLQAELNVRNDRIETGAGLLDQTYLNWFVQFDPSRRFTRIAFFGDAGQRIDFANSRVGNGAGVGINATVRPIDRLTLDLTLNREWLNVTGGRLYSANVERLKTTYSFSAKSLLRVIGQYVATDRARSLYGFDVRPHSSTFLGSVLYSYKLNWQTVLFLGYGDNRELTTFNDLAPVDRSLFFKVSYAIQR